MQIPQPGEPDEDEEVDAALAAWGMRRAEAGEADATEDEPLPDKCYLWPCNLRTFNVWQQVQTQWRQSMAGREGLDYSGVDSYLATVPGFRPKARAELWAGLRAMERAALEVWSAKRD